MQHDIDQLRRRAERGSAQAMYAVAYHLATMPDAEAHRSEAVELLKSAAAKGEKRAQFALGTWYISLRSLYFVPWCEPSAIQRVTESQFFNVRPTMTRGWSALHRSQPAGRQRFHRHRQFAAGHNPRHDRGHA